MRTLYTLLIGIISVFTLPPAARGEDDTAQIESITVTARRLPQSEQDIGTTIFALDEQRIEALRIEQPIDIGNYVPNVNIKNTLGNTNPVITIRGISLNDFVANNDQSAGVYLDEVFMASPAMMSFQVFDVERAEVLLGPQGTLYGRNTTAGAINFISNKPSQDFYTELELGYGNFGRISADAVVNGGITNTLSGRFAMTGDWSDDGHFNNTLTGNEYGELSRWAARGQLAWSPDYDKEFLFNIHGGHDGSDALTNWIAIGILDLSLPGVCAPAIAGDREQTLAQCTDLLGFQDNDGDPFTGAWNLEPRNDTEQYGAVFTADLYYGDSTLTAITAYEAFDRKLQEEADGSPAVGLHIDYKNFIEQFSQEVRWSSVSEKLNWIAGGFLHVDERVSAPSQRINLRDWFNDVLFVEWDQDTRSAAVFGHVEWPFKNTWRLVGGARYTWEEKEIFSSSRNTVPFGGVSRLTGSNVPVRISRDSRFSNTELTGDAGVEYFPINNLLAYFKFSKGFKSGGFTGLLVGSQEELDPYDEEELFAYEAGVKTTFLEQRLRLNAALFYYDYRNMQVFAIPLDAVNPVPRITNAEKAEIFGLDASLTWLPMTNLVITTNIGWLDTENKDPRFDGLDLPNAPRVSFSNVISYKRRLSNDWTIAPVFYASYQDEAFKTLENQPLLKAENYWLVNARLALQKNNRWEIALWGNNLTDEEYIVEAFDQAGAGVLIYNYGMPRTYGVSLSYRWD